ncbi:MAG: flavin reductase family protein [Treponema sp.]|jgi:flavin reductase (DIM6/NTAB) family NADH-FMN oxidoreductase RutF|nr:flavin reductase family protein [Treponema sp.]
MEQKKVVPAGNEWACKHIRDFSGSPVSRIGEEWMLITSGSTAVQPGNWNTMTASWGGFGVLWGKAVAFMFIRPTRFTYTLANDNALFTLSFFDMSYRPALDICGTKSGLDTDKAAQADLTPVVFGDGGIGFQEAAEIITCRKLYVHDFDPARFLDPSIEALYPARDYHRMFIGEILTLRVKS